MKSPLDMIFFLCRAGWSAVLIIAILAIAASLLTELSRPGPKVGAYILPAADQPSVTQDATSKHVASAALPPPGAVAPADSDDEGSEPAVASSSEPARTISFWDASAKAWTSDETIAGLSAGAETIPVLLRLEGTVAGNFYGIAILYPPCPAPDGSCFDYLTGVEPSNDEELARRGPGRISPDSTIPAPDPAIQGAGNPGLFELWGATFAAAPQALATPASGGPVESIILQVKARSDNVILLLAGHLASGDTLPETSPKHATVPIIEAEVTTAAPPLR